MFAIKKTKKNSASTNLLRNPTLLQRTPKQQPPGNVEPGDPLSQSACQQIFKLRL